MYTPHFVSRRHLLLAAVTTPLLISSCGEEREETEENPPILPVEDLMREHGLLDRVLLVYEQALAQSDIPWPVIGSAARIVHLFIENYHEKQEEEDVFPLMEHAGQDIQLIAILRQQHAIGRQLTQQIEHVLTQLPTTDADRTLVTNAVRNFVHMYRAHAAHEDTDLFPALRQLVTGHDYEALGDKFEQRERAVLGKEGFKQFLPQVAKLEMSVGIADLSIFTPRIS